MSKFLVTLINLYQHTLSPDHSWLAARYPYGFCRYSPSCSEYAKQALIRHGVVKGLFLSIKRVLRCNPYASFGPDPVPEKIEKANITVPAGRQENQNLVSKLNI